MKRHMLLLACAVWHCSAFQVKITGSVRVGGGSKKFWKPKGGVVFGDDEMAMNVQTEKEGCTKCGEETVFTVDGGDKFHEYSGAEKFCGSQSFWDKEKSKRICADEQKQETADDSIKMPVLEWTITKGGLVSSPSMAVERTDVKLTVWTQSIKREQPEKIRFGDNLIDAEDKKLMFRLAEVTFKDEKHNVILKSQDNGYSWFYLGTLPISIGQKNSIERQGENGFVVYTTSENYTIYSIHSKTLGRKWGNATEVTHFQNLPVYLNTRFTSLLGGGRRIPSLAAVGSKKGSEKFFNLAEHHNKFMDDDKDYPEGFLTSLEGDKKAAQCRPEADAQHENCASSGLVSVLSFGEDKENKNLTKLLMCYDKLGKEGWHSQGDDEVYCMKAHVDEGKELAAHEAKMKKREERRKQEQEAKERAQKYAEEQRQRKKQQKREKDRKLRQQRQEWAKIDRNEYIRPARDYYMEDDDMVVVRDVSRHASFADFMDETVGLPTSGELAHLDDVEEEKETKDKETKEEAKEAKEEAKETKEEAKNDKKESTN